MLNDASGFSHVYLCTGYTDLRLQWPRNEKETKELTPQQYLWLMEGFL